MKRVTWIDKDGYARCSLIRDEDDPNFPEVGLPVEPPPIESIMIGAAKELRNELVLRNILTYRDLMDSNNDLTSIINGVLRRKLIEAYKLQELNNG
jgi:hypothetical protein